MPEIGLYLLGPLKFIKVPWAINIPKALGMGCRVEGSGWHSMFSILF